VLLARQTLRASAVENDCEKRTQENVEAKVAVPNCPYLDSDEPAIQGVRWNLKSLIASSSMLT
jgi:hypothetical protein